MRDGVRGALHPAEVLNEDADAFFTRVVDQFAIRGGKPLQIGGRRTGKGAHPAHTELRGGIDRAAILRDGLTTQVFIRCGEVEPLLVHLEVREHTAGVCGGLTQLVEVSRLEGHERGGHKVDHAHVEFVTHEARKIEQAQFAGLRGFDEMPDEGAGGDAELVLQDERRSGGQGERQSLNKAAAVHEAGSTKSLPRFSHGPQ